MKKSLKKVVALVSLVMCVSCTMVTPLNASATSTYLQGDVNGDGSVNVSDTQLARQFLQGMKGANGSTAERLDADKNGIIDENDVNLIRNIVLHITNGSTISSSNTVALPLQENRTYYVYNATTGYKINSECYTLNTSDVPQITPVTSRSIVNNVDERRPENGLKGVLKTTTGGTAFVIDDHTILTAAHCLQDFYDTSVNKANYAISNVGVKFYNEYNQVDNTITVTPLRYHIPSQYAENRNQSYDYAIVTVQEDLSAYINFTLGVARDCVVSVSNPNLYTTGFGCISESDIGNYPGVNPIYINGDKVTSYLGGFLLENGKLGNYTFKFTDDVLPGNSGGPIYTIQDGMNIVVGICIAQSPDLISYNRGVRITTDILQFVYNNENL